MSAPTGAIDEPHQADSVLRAFRYQLLQTIWWWLNLRHDEELWIEVSEDFAVISPTRATNVQVKHSETAHGPRPLSLRSNGVSEAILRYWLRSEGGARQNYLTFIARGGAAREQNSEFPESQAGLQYWPIAATHGNTAPLRSLLLDVFSGTALGQWLGSSPTDEELRKRLLQPIHFALESKSDEAVEQVIRDRLGALYLEKKHLASAAEQGLSMLIAHAFKVAGMPNASDRRLTHIELHLTLEKAIPRMGALAQPILGAEFGIQNLADGGFVTELRGRFGAIDRKTLVDELKLRLVGQRLAWFHGSNGTGKSTLAGLLARAMGGNWLECDFRTFSQGNGRGSLAVWRELIRTLNRGPAPAGVILDDLSLDAADLLKNRIGGLAEVLDGYGAKLIVTSNHKPSSALQAAFGASASGVINVPYFTVDEVRELVNRPPAPDVESLDAWTKLIHATTSWGHPVLAVAKIGNLRNRGWPDIGLMEDFGSRVGPGVSEARQEARIRLINELNTAQQRSLLDRVSAVFMMFDRALAIKLGTQEPTIDNPGDAFAQLLGSWIEPSAEGYWRLSPLISDLHNDLPQSETGKWRQVAAMHWMEGNTLDQRTLPLAFWNGYLGKHFWVLLKLGQVILTLPAETLRATAAILSPLSALSTVSPLFDQPIVASMLRLLQIRVADASEDVIVATAAARAWIREIEAVEPDGVRNLQFVTASPSFFDLEQVTLPVSLRLEFLRRLHAAVGLILASEDDLIRSALDPMLEHLPSGTDIPGFYFTRLLMSASSSAGLEEIITALDDVESQLRTRWLNSAERLLEGAGVWIHNPWAKEQLSDKDLALSLECYRRMSRIVQKWADTDLHVEFAVALSVILDEGVNDATAAIEAVDDALAAFREAPLLIRQKYKVLSRRGDHAQAATLFLENRAALVSLHAFDRALAIREGGLACARAGLYYDARVAFSDAREILLQRDIREDLRIGLMLEEALAAWAAGDRAEGLQLVASALEQLETIDPAATRQGRRALRAATAMTLAFSEDLPHSFPDAGRRSVAFGQPSQLESTKDPDAEQLPDIRTAWALLTLAETVSDMKVNIAARSEPRLVTHHVDPNINSFILSMKFTAAIAQRRIETAVELAKPAVGALMSLANDRLRGEGRQESMLQGALADIILSHALSGTWTTEAEHALRAAVRAKFSDESLLMPLLAAARQNSLLTAESPAITTCSLVPSLNVEPPFSPQIRFARDIYLVQATVSSLARPALEPLTVRRLADGWRHVLKLQRFRLVAPMRLVPALEAAIASLESRGLTGVTEPFFVAASEATGVALSPEWIRLFRLVDTASPRAPAV